MATITFEEEVVTILVDEEAFRPIEDIMPGCETGDYHMRVIKFGDQPVALTYTIVDDVCLPRGDLGEALLWVDITDE